MWKKFLPLVPVLLLAGCASPFTRLTPSMEPRSANNMYPVETSFNSSQQSLRWDSIKAYVMVDGQAYPMRKVPMIENRWEGFIPVPAGATSVQYRFKFDYQYNTFGSNPKPDSKISPIYTLNIVNQ